MAGIYIHIPFCKQRCIYCNFHLSTQTKTLPAVIEAIVKEIQLRKSYISEPVETIYFGGGTPSICNQQQLKAILDACYQHFSIIEDAEITLEINPDDVDKSNLTGWKTLGFNRLSIGIQSFDEEELEMMFRVHNPFQATKSIVLAQELGFNNISADLIYGSPYTTHEKWQQHIATLISYKVPHISCYALTSEPKTAMNRLIALKKFPTIDPDFQAQQFTILQNAMEQAGYHHYEISNFALPGFESKHNRSYWQNKPYIGIGPSAHSYNGSQRQWNIANNNLYIQYIENGKTFFELENLTSNQQFNEYIMTSLRTSDGTDLQKVAEKWGLKYASYLQENAVKYVNTQQIEITPNQFMKLTKEGRFLADGIAADFFILDEE